MRHPEAKALPYFLSRGQTDFYMTKIGNPLRTMLAILRIFLTFTIMINITHKLKVKALVTGSMLTVTLLSGCGGGGLASEATATSSAQSLNSTAAAASPSAATSSVLKSSVRVAAATSCASSTTWGSFERPFAADSPWNSRPSLPVLGSAVIPLAQYSPLIDNKNYSSAAFKATSTDGPMTVYGATSSGVWDPDAEAYTPSVVIPRWPAGVTPAAGNDGHAEIVDTVAGVVHSFFRLKQVSGVWQAEQHAWTSLNGRGFGNPSQYFQGSRSAGVSTLGGLIRKHEVNDGDTLYRHALAMSLDFTGLSKNPTYVFPATSADWNAATANSGPFPLGSLMMLPADFDTQRIATPQLRKIAETLKTYGAYLVDRNYGTPFVIYMEIGSAYNNGWTSTGSKDLELMRQSLRKVESASGWFDGDDNSFSTFNTNLNLISMRGGWYRLRGPVSGVFDSQQQAVVFPPTTTEIFQGNGSGRAFSGVTWARPKRGGLYRLRAITTGGGKFKMTIKDQATGQMVYDSGQMTDGQTVDFTWPTDTFVVITYATSGISNQVSTVSAELKAVSSATAATSSCGS